MQANGLVQRARRAYNFVRSRTLAGVASRLTLDRERIARHYITGQGIEIGALHRPLYLGRSACVRYVDRLPTDVLRRHYPELSNLPLVHVDILDDGERLGTIADATQDFVIANHMLEHCQDPFGAIAHMLRVLRVGGCLFLAVPDKRRTFDAGRTATPLEHLLRDHAEGPEWSRQQHFEDWVRHVEKIVDEREAANQVARLLAIDYSIHFHVWRTPDLVRFLLAVPEVLGVPCELELLLQSGQEAIAVVRKGDALARDCSRTGRLLRDMRRWYLAHVSGGAG